ncbi:response regulator transcription factor [Rufibacter glacialis]|uniref:Response regulator transcription factor n=1 Tax=Rufibacter glacialis TaxID=1259555 RepID=A0A5M8QIB7_9BACT|nr:response regulator transcription factor [Rufibacter glacialis]KAA6434536.1 response regulator transcription factor [Rufibacter glacialis]GGK70436.1 transcriptional regulator [Rufibacter glacialis]
MTAHTATRLLLVEDDPNFGMVLKDYLELHDYEVTLCTDGLQGLRTFQKEAFDACILDVMMPLKDGFSLATDIKKADPQMPVIFLTAKAMKADMLEGFRIGADDYITKPFDSEILLCKLKAILQRKAISSAPEKTQSTEYQLGRYHFNAKTRLITHDGETQKLSPKEAELLLLLCQYLNDVLPREVALSRIWKDDNYFTARSMDVFVTKLRKYLKADPSVEIINVHGNGFRLVAPVNEAQILAPSM